ncbi:MAG TPA: hypothetical protein VHM66_03315 [Solirubrobacterales bacterium]|nr:hypothetical protein [Solirubrobacterales bacterium]
MTISGEVMPGASVRWLLIYLGAATVGTWVPLGLSAEGLAWIVAAAPLAPTSLRLDGRRWGETDGH